MAANLPKAEAIQDYVTKLSDVFGKVLGVDYGLDFINDIPVLTIRAGRSIPIPTGIRIAIPEGYEMQVRPRSGNAIKLGLTVINSPGTVDSDFRGEIMILAHNNSDKSITITHKMKIAQGVIAPYFHANGT